jgi:hypothetical protein
MICLGMGSRGGMTLLFLSLLATGLNDFRRRSANV